MDPTTLRMFSGAAAAPAAPASISFTANNYSLYGDVAATLSWAVTDATSVSIDQGIGTVAASSSTNVTGSRQTRTYTLTAINQDSISYTSSVTISWGAPYCFWADRGLPEWC